MTVGHLRAASCDRSSASSPSTTPATIASTPPPATPSAIWRCGVIDDDGGAIGCGAWLRGDAEPTDARRGTSIETWPSSRGTVTVAVQSTRPGARAVTTYVPP